MHFSGDAAELLAQMFGARRGTVPRSAFGGGSGGFASMFSQMFGGMEDDFGAGGAFGFPGGSGGRGRYAGGETQGAETYAVEVTLEELFAGATKVVAVPHRLRMPGSPMTYTYKHQYTIRLKPHWRDGTTLKFPSSQVNLAQLGHTRLPPVLLKLQTAKHKYFERIGDDLVVKITLSAAQAGRRLKLKLPLLDGTELSFETRGRISHGAIQEFPGRGMPISGRGVTATKSGVQEYGKLFVQFQFAELLEKDDAGDRAKRKTGASSASARGWR